MSHNTIHDKIDRSTWMTLKELDIARRTKRGCSSGVNKQRHIKTIISDRTIQRFASASRVSAKHRSTKSTTSVNRRNSICVHKSNSRTPYAKFAAWNAQSIKEKSKSGSIIDFVDSNHLDIFAVTETWLTGDHRDNRFLADINRSLPVHVCHHIPRGSRGGSVGCYFAEDSMLTSIKSFRSPEYSTTIPL